MLSYFFEEATPFKYGAMFRKILEKRENWEEKLEGIVTLSDKNTRSTFKSYLDGDKVISLKYNLANRFSDLPFMPATYLLFDGKKRPAPGTHDLKGEGIWFLKPSDKFTGEGKDIMLFSSPSDFEERRGEIPRLGAYPKWVLQKEVYPPFLFEGKKVIIRYFITSFVRNGTIFFYSVKKARVNIGARPWKKGALEEASMISHNTENLLQGTGTYVGSEEGMVSMDGSRWELREDMKGVFKAIEEAMRTLLRRASTSFCPRDPWCFMVYGMDFSMDKTMKPYLIEVNEHPLLDFDTPILKEIISFPLLSDCVDTIELLYAGKNPLLDMPMMKALIKTKIVASDGASDGASIEARDGAP